MMPVLNYIKLIAENNSSVFPVRDIIMFIRTEITQAEQNIMALVGGERF